MDQVDHSGFNTNPFAPKSDLGINQQISRHEMVAKTMSFASYQPVLLPHTAATATVFKECLKNHAASLGGHALDGCGEFMPEPTDNGLMKCAACGCHRNFHRQETAEHRREQRYPPASLPSSVGITPPHFSLLPRRFASSPSTSPSRSPSPPRQLNPPPPPPPPPPSAAAHMQQYSPGPHMLMALSTGKGASPPPSDDHQNRKNTPTQLSSPTTDQIIKLGSHHHHQTRRNQNPNPSSNSNGSGGSKSRKRFRSKFSSEQKEKMRRFSEELNWRIQRSDEKLVSEFCADVGVSKTVLKVWMHNNKNTVGKIPRISNNNSNHSSSNNVENDHELEDQADQQLHLSHHSEDHHQTNNELGLISHHHHHHLGNNGSSGSA